MEKTDQPTLVKLESGKTLRYNLQHTNKPATFDPGGELIREREACTTLSGDLAEPASEGALQPIEGTLFNLVACCNPKDNFNRSAGRRWAAQHLFDLDTQGAVNRYCQSAGREEMKKPVRSRTAPGRFQDLWATWLVLCYRSKSLRSFTTMDRHNIMKRLCPEFFTNLQAERRARRLARRLGYVLSAK